jgi:hypothetical protein
MEEEMKSSVMIGGKSDSYTRHQSDFYATPEDCTLALLQHFGRLFADHKVWEPACGDGAISKVLLRDGFDVESTDLRDSGYGSHGVDFLTSDLRGGAIITNPPFNLADRFINRSLQFGVPFAMLLKANYWHAAKRVDLFYKKPPRAVLSMAWRPAMAPVRGKSATMDFIWTVWDATDRQEPTQYVVTRRKK